LERNTILYNAIAMNAKKTHGFTLIELLMVVSLIAILMLFSGQFFMNQLKQYSAQGHQTP